MECHSFVVQAEGILVSPRIMADHMPDYVTDTLQRMAREAALSEDLSRTSNGAFILDVPPSPQVRRGSCLVIAGGRGNAVACTCT